MNQYELKKAFVNGDRVYGTLVASPSPKWAAELKKTALGDSGEKQNADVII